MSIGVNGCGFDLIKSTEMENNGVQFETVYQRLRHTAPRA